MRHNAEAIDVRKVYVEGKRREPTRRPTWHSGAPPRPAQTLTHLPAALVVFAFYAAIVSAADVGITALRHRPSPPIHDRLLRVSCITAALIALSLSGQDSASRNPILQDLANLTFIGTGIALLIKWRRKSGAGDASRTDGEAAGAVPAAAVPTRGSWLGIDGAWNEPGGQPEGWWLASDGRWYPPDTR